MKIDFVTDQSFAIAIDGATTLGDGYVTDGYWEPYYPDMLRVSKVY